MLDQELLSSLPSDPMLGAGIIYNRVASLNDYSHILEGFYVFKTYCEKNELPFSYPKIQSDPDLNRFSIQEFYQAILPKIKEYEVASQFDKFSRKPIPIKASVQQDIQGLLNTLREQINGSLEISDEFKRRLLEKVNDLQVEFNKPISDFDLTLGKLGSIGITVRKLCKNAKPILDPINKLLGIVDRVTSHHEGLPPSENLALSYEMEESDDKTAE